MSIDKFVFEFKDYRKYLKYRLLLPEAGRGSRTALARALSSPISHISQVLAEATHFSLEQAEAANTFLNHNEQESEFFLLLVSLTRAGTPALQKRLNTQMNKILEARLLIKDRIEVKKTISLEDQAVFYSSWHYQALHILATIQKYQTPEAMAERLGVSLKKVTEVLDFLVEIGLLVKSLGRYQTTVQRIHLGADSPLISKHHANWRIKSLQSLDREDQAKNLYYSSVISVSEADMVKIRDLTIEHINVVKKIIRESPEEDLFCYSIDCFRV